MAWGAEKLHSGGNRTGWKLGETFKVAGVYRKHMETLFSIMIGLGLSAACGFRVFVPLLVTSIAANSGHLELAPSFQWLASPAAIGAFGLATILEIGAYYVPWLDNLLDTVATPAAVVAGTMVTASMATDMSPLLKWTLAAIAGGGIAGAVQATSVLARGLSLTTTGGLANPIVATAEMGGSIAASVLAIALPAVAAVLLVGVAGLAGYVVVRRRGQNPRDGAAPQTSSAPLTTA